MEMVHNRHRRKRRGLHSIASRSPNSERLYSESAAPLRMNLSPEPAISNDASRAMLAVARDEARVGLREGGLPIGAAIFRTDGTLVSSGHNRRIQQNDPAIHGETDAFRRAGRQKSYRDLIMVTTLAPCWYCSGLVRQFGFRMVIVGESQNFSGGEAWLRSLGIQVIDLADPECTAMMASFIATYPELWNEDIGVDELEAR